MQFPFENQKTVLMDAMPKRMIPRLKNQTTMKKIWEELDKEYRDPDDLVINTYKALESFKFESDKATDAYKFMELYDFYVQITQDLEEIKRSGEMGSVLML